MTTHRIETGAAGYRELTLGRPFRIMPDTKGILPGDMLEIEVVKYRGYDATTTRRATHRVTEISTDNLVLCDAKDVSAAVARGDV